MYELQIKIIGFNTDTGAIDNDTNNVLKEIAELVCRGQLPGDQIPNSSDINMRHLLKQFSQQKLVNVGVVN